MLTILEKEKGVSRTLMKSHSVNWRLCIML